jgi:hypothetical protein
VEWAPFEVKPEIQNIRALARGNSSEVLDGVLLLLFLPEGEVLLEQLDDALGVSKGLLIDIVDFLKGIRQGLLTELAGLLVVVHHLVVEHREVEGQTKSDWVAGVQTLGGGLSELVVFEGTVLDRFKLVSLGALGNVSVVVSNHFVEECLGLIGGGDLHALSLNNVDDGDALIVKLTLDLLLVGRETVVELLVLGVLLDGTDGSNGGSLGADLVLETNGKEVSLLSGEVLILGLNNFLQVEDHIVESLGLLSDSGHKNVFFQ